MVSTETHRGILPETRNHTSSLFPFISSFEREDGGQDSSWYSWKTWERLGSSPCSMESAKGVSRADDIKGGMLISQICTFT
jgi:hypothetical protein